MSDSNAEYYVSNMSGSNAYDEYYVYICCTINKQIDPMTNEYSTEYTVQMKMKIEMILEVDPIHSIINTRVVNFAMITMGSRLTCYTKDVEDDGLLEFTHKFEPIAEEGDYYNQTNTFRKAQITDVMKSQGFMYDEKQNNEYIKSHCILWLYRRHVESQKSESSRQTQHKDASADNLEGDDDARRCYLIGSAIIDLKKLDDFNHQNDNKTPLIYNCVHNFNPNPLDPLSYAIVTFERPTKLEPSPLAAINFFKSTLMAQFNTASIVTTQQDLVQNACIQKIKTGEMVLMDETSAGFISNSTFLQLHMAAVCFTDMTSIVKKRAASLPMLLGLIYGYAGIIVNNIPMNDLISMKNDCDILLTVFASMLSAELMDSKQSEYYSDYCIYGVELCTEFDYRTNRQPMVYPAMPGAPISVDKISDASDRWFYDVIEDKKPHIEDKKQANKYIRFKLRLTEDQRQVCAGDNLQNRMIADDCESSASFIVTVWKLFMEMKAVMLKINILTDTLNDDTWEITCQDLNIWDRLIQNLGISNGEYTKYFDRITIIQVLQVIANIFRHFEVDVVLCVGTANASGIGQASNLCGHCYAMIKAMNLRTAQLNSIRISASLMDHSLSSQSTEGNNAVISQTEPNCKRMIIEGSLRKCLFDY